MALKIRIKKPFETRLEKVVHYLDSEWNSKVTDDFLQRLWSRVDRLSQQPNIGIPSLKVQGARSILITKHNRLYYKVEGDYLILLTLFDTRVHPRKNRYD